MGGGFNIRGIDWGGTRLLCHGSKGAAELTYDLFLRTLQNELRPNQAKITVKQIAKPTLPNPAWPR
jgi:hypothetical protein